MVGSRRTFLYIVGDNHFFLILESGQAPSLSGPSYASAVKGNSPPPSD